ncbi:MAG: PQQ-binding-like beta-propeller repeat protein [Gemmataceae bacterium]|nr:PQQ-binding-like beta-propeller repeat protein [Gemmataceae bacterium]
MRQFLGLFGVVALLTAGGADWPRFRGPDGLGVAVGATPPTKWTATDGVKWKAALPGPGSSSPVVWGDRVFVTCYSGYGIDAASPGSIEKLTRHLVCVDRNSGRILWKSDIAASNAEDPYRGYVTEHGYASNSPATDGEAVYAFFSKSGVVAYDLEGKKLWQTAVGVESDERRWGSSASPVLFKGLVIVNAASEARAVIALDKKTGKQVWKAEGKRLNLSFSTPALVSSGERTDLVVAMPTEVWGLNPETGKLLWHTAIKPSGNVCAGVLPGDGIAYVTGGFQTKGTLAVKVGGSGDVAAKNLLWSVSKSSYVPTPVLHGGLLMNVNEDGFAVCQNAETGKTVYDERLAVKGVGGRGSRPFYASPVLADGRLYAVSRQAGMFVLRAGDKFELLHQNPPLDDSDFNATPAVVGKQLLLRSNKFLYCLEGP